MDAFRNISLRQVSDAISARIITYLERFSDAEETALLPPQGAPGGDKVCELMQVRSDISILTGCFDTVGQVQDYYAPILTEKKLLLAALETSLARYQMQHPEALTPSLDDLLLDDFLSNNGTSGEGQTRLLLSYANTHSYHWPGKYCGDVPAASSIASVQEYINYRQHLMDEIVAAVQYPISRQSHKQ